MAPETYRSGTCRIYPKQLLQQRRQTKNGVVLPDEVKNKFLTFQHQSHRPIVLDVYQHFGPEDPLFYP